MSSDQNTSSDNVSTSDTDASAPVSAVGTKRPRVDDVDAMDVADGYPTAAAATTSSTSTTEPSFSRDLISKAISRVLDDYVGLYEKARRELRHREVSYSVLKSHSEKGTVPQDLRVSIGTGNPYASCVKNRDQLLAQEREIWEEAKRRILNQRMHVLDAHVTEARDNVVNMEKMETFLPYLLQEKFGGRLTLPAEIMLDLPAAFQVHITASKTKMDKLHAQLDEKYKAKQEKKARSTPTTTEAVDQATFTRALRSEVEEMLHKIIDAPLPKTKLTKKQDQAKPSMQRPQATKKSDKRSFADIVAGKKTSSPQRNTKPSQRHETNGQDGTKTKKAPPPPPPKKKNENSSRRVEYRRRMPAQEEDEDDDGFRVVRNRRWHQKTQQRQKNAPTLQSKTREKPTKNESAQDQRTRPKERSSRQRR